MQEVERVQERYARRQSLSADLYSPLKASVWMRVQEQERVWIRWIHACGIAPVAEKRLLEIGCGMGSNLLHLLLLGFAPENLVGNELMSERAAIARQRLPEAV